MSSSSTTTAFPAPVRRPGEPRVPADRSAVAQAARQNLVDQHVCCLDPDTDDPREETNRGRRSFLVAAQSRNRPKRAHAAQHPEEHFHDQKIEKAA